jgi:PII-like signaling protein
MVVKLEKMCALRIYLRRGEVSEGSGFWRRLFRRSLATHVVHEALSAGVPHASVSYAKVGFVKGSRVIATDVSEFHVDELPVCVELAGPRPMLEQFVRDHGNELRDATMMLVEGVHVRTPVQDSGRPIREEAVEYVRVESLAQAEAPQLEGVGDLYAALSATPQPTR